MLYFYARYVNSESEKIVHLAKLALPVHVELGFEAMRLSYVIQLLIGNKSL